MLWLTVPIAVWEAYSSRGIGRVMWGPWAIGLTLILGAHRLRGGPARTLVQWLAGIAGMVFSLGALATLVLGVLLITRGSFGILAGLVLIPLSLGVGVWGWGLLATALYDPDRRRRYDIDLEAARNAPAVRRFDALHRKGEGPRKVEDAVPEDDEPTASG
jgi:hypothetical protein